MIDVFCHNVQNNRCRRFEELYFVFRLYAVLRRHVSKHKDLNHGHDSVKSAAKIK